MDALTIVASVSALIAAASALLSLRTFLYQRRMTQHTANYSQIAHAESMITDHAELLQLHGVTPQFLNDLGLSSVEAVYLIHSFTAGDLYYRIGGPSELTPYRRAMLDVPKVQNAWKSLLRGRFISQGIFSSAVDTYLAAKPTPQLPSPTAQSPH